MRWFIVLLLLANLALFFWLQHDALPEAPVAALPPPDIGRLELLPSDSFDRADRPSAPTVREVPVGEPVPAVGSAESPDAAESVDREEPVNGLASSVSDGVERPVDAAALAGSMSELSALQDRVTAAAPVQATGLETTSHAAGGQSGAAQTTDERFPQPQALPTDGEATPDAAGSEPVAAQTIDAPFSEEPSTEVASPHTADPVSEPLSELEPGPEPSGDPLAEPPPESEPERVVAVCAQVGPLTPEQADTLIERLPVFVILLSDVAEEVREVNAYYVMTPRLGSRAEGLQMLEALEQAGITDTWLFTRGRYRNAISLGLFSRRSGALRWQRDVVDRGFDAQVVERSSTSERRRLLLKNVDGGDIALSLPLPEGVSADKQPCP